MVYYYYYYVIVFSLRSSIQQPLSQSPWEDVQNGEQLNRILQAFGQSFMQTDIAVFRQNLATLQLLNTKFRLYSKSVFRTLLSQFITVLLQVICTLISLTDLVL